MPYLYSSPEGELFFTKTGGSRGKIIELKKQNWGTASDRMAKSIILRLFSDSDGFILSAVAEYGCIEVLSTLAGKITSLLILDYSMSQLL